MASDDTNDVAVIGLGLRFPGNASSPDGLWNVLERKESQWSEFPKDRMNIDGYYHPSGDRQGSISFKGAHFLSGDVGAFDAPFFSITTEDAKAIDPQQRLLLEISYEALENAGIRKEDIDGSDTAVYVGSFVKDYEQICLRDPDWQPQYAATGNGIAIMANRISYFFNLHGPSVTIDTGCSGSLVAVHLAAQSILRGESSLAIAAGAGMILTPNTIMPMTALNFLSPDGKCFTFDSRANGYGRGEGVGVVVLKRLSDAIRDNDSIRAVIRASKVNQDGRTTGITLPSKEAQVANIRSVYSSAGLKFDQTAYVECHGTGTQAGDWRELKAISETLASCRPIARPLYVGSVKTNIGHLEGSAGVAGLIKGVLVLEHGVIPPNINFEKGNPNIDFEEWRVKVPTSMTPWPVPGVRRVSVNCFGFGGTNAHVIMDEAPDATRAANRPIPPKANSHLILSDPTFTNGNVTPDWTSHLFCYSAHEQSGIHRTVKAHLEFLQSKSRDFLPKFLADYSYTLGVRRSNMEWKYTLVASTGSELLAKMQSIDSQSVLRSSRNKQPRICFVFCGQGAQWAQMGKDLLAFPPFRKSLEQAALHLKLIASAPFDLLEEILKDPTESRIEDPSIAQPATTALQVALVDLLRAFGISPQYVVGHSSGEIAAVFAAGAISREAAWEIAFFRGAAAATLPIKAPKLKGGMMVVGMSLSETEKYLETNNSSAQIACINSPRSITLSGKADSLQHIAEDLRQKKVFVRMLNVSIAYHSSYMKLVEAEYRDSLGHLQPHEFLPTVSMFSSVTGGKLMGAHTGAEYWCENLVSPVKYVAALEAMMDLPASERPDILVELSPTSALRSPTSDILADLNQDHTTLYLSALSRQGNGSATFLETLGELWTRGCQVDMKKVVTQGSDEGSLRCLTELPPYAWNHDKSYWHESHLNEATRFRKYARQDLIGAPTADSVPFEPRWRGFLRISESPWIQDHQVQKTIVYPAAGMVAMVLEGAVQMVSGTLDLLGYEISEMQFEKAMVIPNTAHGLEVALNIKEISTTLSQFKGYEFVIYSKPLDKAWERHARGYLRFRFKLGNYRTPFRSYDERFSSLDASCHESVTPRQLYEKLDAVGMNYGSLFRNITSIRRGDGSCICTVRDPDTKSKMPANFEYPHLLHPATLDSMFQSLFVIDPVPMVPTFIKSLFVSTSVGETKDTEFSGYATANRIGVRDAEATIVMQRPGLDDAYVSIEGLRLTGLSTSLSQSEFLPNHHSLCTEIVWKQDVDSARPSTLSEQIALFAHKVPSLAILQVGGDWEMTQAILRVVAPTKTTPCLRRYTVVGPSSEAHSSDISEHLKGAAVTAFVEIKSYDELDSLGDYHLVINFRNDGNSIEGLRRHLKTGGLILDQVSQQNGLTNGNGNGNGHIHLDPSPQFHAAVDDGHYVEHLDDSHKHKITLRVHKYPESPGPRSKDPPSIVVLTLDVPDLESSALVESLERQFKSRQVNLSVTSITTSQLAESVEILRDKVVISILDFTTIQSPKGAVYGWTEKDFETFQLLHKTAKAIIWVTRGAHMQPTNPHGAPIIALARTLMSEDALKTIITFDLASETGLGDAAALDGLLTIFTKAFIEKTTLGQLDTEYAERLGELFIPRFQPVTSMNELIEDDKYDASLLTSPKPHQDTSSLLKGTKLIVSEAGLAKGGTSWVEFTTQELGADEVEISFDEAPLTHLDIDTAMGRTAATTFGLDVRGKVRRVGSDVANFQVGDDVVGLALKGAFSDIIHVNQRLVRKYQPGLLASPLIIAYYGLVHHGRAGQGRKILVQGGASAFGVVAVKMAQSLGSEVYATVLGPEVTLQRQILVNVGLPDDHILDANSEDFLLAIEAATNGKGVDVLFNPTQEHVAANFRCVHKCGTIVQFASQAHESMRVPRSAMSLVNLDFSELLKEDVDFVARLLDDALQYVSEDFSNVISSSKPSSTFALDEVEDALKEVEKAPYCGYVSIRGNFVGNSGFTKTNSKRLKPLHEALYADGTYLLAGGLGGLGQSIAELLTRNGVRHLVFLSRSGASSEHAKAVLETYAKKGVTARAFAVDICDEAALADVVARVKAEMPPVRGVFQCAAVIKDAVFENMSYASWIAAFRPKTLGSWNLTQTILTSGSEPFFIFLSSSAGVIGSRGQANYAAGNCFQDALAHQIRLGGKHAVSVDLGPVLEAGMLAEDEETMDILRASGFYAIRHGDFLKVLAHAITMETTPGEAVPAQIILGIGTGGLIRQNQPADPYWSKKAIYSYLNLVDMPAPDLALADMAADKDPKAMLASCEDVGAAADIVCTRLKTVLAKLMNMLLEEMDADKTASAYGVDSLVAVGVRNCVFSDFGVQVSVFEVLSESTIAELALMVAERGGFGVEA